MHADRDHDQLESYFNIALAIIAIAVTFLAYMIQ
jgi:hypothetical protein